MPFPVKSEGEIKGEWSKYKGRTHPTRYYAPQPLPLLGEGRGERAIAGSLEPVNESRQGSKPSALQLMTDDMYVYSSLFNPSLYNRICQVESSKACSIELDKKSCTVLNFPLLPHSLPLSASLQFSEKLAEISQPCTGPIVQPSKYSVV